MKIGQDWRCLTKRIGLILVLCLCMTGFYGCDEDEEQEETKVVSVFPGEHLIHVMENGTVTDQMVESFDASKYDQNQLRADVETELKEVNQESEQVTLEKLKLADGKMTIVFRYVSTAAYEAYNKKYVTGEPVVLFKGTVEEAANAGYEIEQNFVKAGSSDSVGADVIKADADLKVVVTSEACKVMVDHPIVYVSEGVSIDTGAAVTKADTLNYIFYKESKED